MAEKLSLFKRYLLAVKRTGFIYPDDEDASQQGWKAEQVETWGQDRAKRELILAAREAFLAIVPDPPQAAPSVESQPDDPAPALDPNQVLFESKIVPSFEADLQTWQTHGKGKNYRVLKTGTFRTEAVLAASNLQAWAEAIEGHARTNNTAFFLELAEAIKKSRRLWDKTDERILANYNTSSEFPKPLKDCTEDEGAELLGMTLGAFDKRLQRLGIKRKGGRPRKQD